MQPQGGQHLTAREHEIPDDEVVFPVVRPAGSGADRFKRVEAAPLPEMALGTPARRQAGERTLNAPLASVGATASASMGREAPHGAHGHRRGAEQTQRRPSPASGWRPWR